MDIQKTSLKGYKFLFLFIVIGTVIGILIFPQQVFGASKNGLLLWFNTVFPSLFPFMIGTYLLIELGVVHFIGILFEPIMRPIFNVPGVGAFAWIMGIVSGYPIGAKITADLRANGQISQTEAQRLIAFANNSGPLFILGAVSVGMLSKPQVGMFLLGIHYLSSLSVGILFRFYKREKLYRKQAYDHLFKNAVKELIIRQKKQSKKLGNILKESIIKSMELITQIGGFIILFSVIAELLKLFSIMKFFNQIFSTLFSVIGFDNRLINGWILGIIEITNGINLIGSSSAPLSQQLILVNSIIAWGGLSIFMQTVSMVSDSDIKISIYGLAKWIQSIFAFVYTILLYPYMQNVTSEASTVFKFFQYTRQGSSLIGIWPYIYGIFCILFILVTKKNNNRKSGIRRIFK